MKPPRSIVANIVCERSMDARREDAVHDSEGNGDRNEAGGILKLEEKVEISLIVLLSRAEVI